MKRSLTLNKITDLQKFWTSLKTVGKSCGDANTQNNKIYNKEIVVLRYFNVEMFYIVSLNNKDLKKDVFTSMSISL